MSCLSGCHRDSKQSSLVTYVQKGEKEGLEISDNTEVEYIEHKSDKVIIWAKKNGKPVIYSTKKLVISGNSFGTNKILQNSGFKKYLPELGKYFSSHPQFMSFGIQEDPVDAHKGYFQTVASKDPNFRAAGFKLENVFAPPISTSMLFNARGVDHQRIMKKYRYLNCIEVAVRDENVGEISVKKGKLVVTKPLTDQDKKRRDLGKQAIVNVLNASGAKEIIDSPFYFGLHLMGGCVMGNDKKNSCVSPEFNLHGFKNIYVSDSSLFPNAPGINPSYTIFAMAERLSEQLTS